MKPISVPYALSVCAAAAMLAACGAPGQLPNPAAQTPVGHVGAPLSSYGTETLTGTAKLGRCKEHYIHHGNVIVGEAYRTHFHAHGTATGPYDGNFIADGHWESTYEFPFEFWNVLENFTITSATSTISGTIEGGGADYFPTCTSFGPLTYNLPYTSNDGNGNANIQAINQGDFSETLDGL